jgi:all-trans-8'-apo-beta-carotenal 15,15'-oxygenase
MRELPAGRLARVPITNNNRVNVDDICHAPGEFPEHDWRRASRPYRYSYYSGSEPAIFKADDDTGTHRAHALASGYLPGEPIFVARDDRGAEDDGWLLVLVAGRERTELHVLDADDLAADPLAVAQLPRYAFPGFHGMVTPGSPKELGNDANLSSPLRERIVQARPARLAGFESSAMRPGRVAETPASPTER